MLFFKKYIGQLGEKEAVRYLKKKKYKILETNYTNYYGEIDIVAKDKQYLVFVEVKTRTGTDYGFAAEAVNFQKQKKLKVLAQTYAEKSYDVNIRFDVVEVYVNKENNKVSGINHIENAFGF